MILLDGGMGRELMRMGAPFRQPEWSALALIEAPNLVTVAHGNFVAAGASVITTNSYAIVPFHIGAPLFASDGQRLAAVAGRCARDAADNADHRVLVAGSLPPLFGSYQPELFDPLAAPSILTPLIAGLAPYVDLWLGETLSRIDEARCVRAAIDRIGDTRPLWLSFTLDDHRPGCLRSGESIDLAVQAAHELGAGAVLFNCCQTETISSALRSLVGTTTLRIGGYANRFVDSHDSDGAANADLSPFRDDMSPSEYSSCVRGWIDDGAEIVGGCCGMGPEHIAELRSMLASATPEPRKP